MSKRKVNSPVIAYLFTIHSPLHKNKIALRYYFLRCHTFINISLIVLPHIELLTAHGRAHHI